MSNPLGEITASPPLEKWEKDMDRRAKEQPSSNPKLLPCPICGCSADIRESAVWGEHWGQLERVVWCSSSHCRLQMRLPADIHNVESRLAEKWNRRAVETNGRPVVHPPHVCTDSTCRECGDRGDWP